MYNDNKKCILVQVKRNKKLNGQLLETFVKVKSLNEDSRTGEHRKQDN